MSQNSVVHPKMPRCSYAQSSEAPLIVSDGSHVKSSYTECDGYPVSSVPIAASCFHVQTSPGGSFASGCVDDGRRMTPPLVWYALNPQMFGRATIARTSA